MEDSMFRLARYLKNYKIEVIIGPLFKLIEAVFELIVPLVMASIIDVGIKNGDKNYVIRQGIVIVLLGVGGLLFALVCQYVASKASQGVGTKLRDDLYAHINELSHGEVDELGTNKIITIITNDVNQIQLSVAMLIRLVTRSPFLVIGATIMSFIIDWKLSIIFLLAAVLVSIVLYTVMKRSVPYYKKRQKALDQVSLLTRETLSGSRVVRAFARQETEKARFDEANTSVADIAIRVGKISALLNPAIFIILNIAIIFIIWFGGGRVNIGDLTQGEVIALVNYMTQISLALVVVANLVVIFTKASASAARINQVFDTIPGMVEGRYAGDGMEGAPILELEQVYFSYPGSSEYSLENINLTIHKGETIGIIGGTGSGKSTLIQLLPRFYDTTTGVLKVNGIPVKDYTFGALRSKFGIVPQGVVLFSGTIGDNMRWRKENASKEEIEEALEIAQAKEFVDRLPKGCDTKIVQGGKNFSGGQKQRLSIARAFVGKPSILILDDSTSALDYATEAKLRKAVRALKDMTIIMASQRASTIKHADQIVVLDDGQIVGLGKHEELLQTCEVYKEICLSQYSSEEVSQL